MIKCTLTNYHTGGSVEYFFHVLPRLGETVLIHGYNLWDDEEWQAFAGLDENDPHFERDGIRSYQVMNIVHYIYKHEEPSIEIILDEFFGDDPNSSEI